MSARWFRVAYARNAFLRCLAESGLDLGTLTPAAGARAMLAFSAGYRPQHGVLDELVCAWGPTEGGFEFSVTRRLQRDGQPESPLSLRFAVDASAPGRGEAVVTTLAELRATDGYRALGRSRVVERSLEQLALEH